MNARIATRFPVFGELVEGGFFHGAYLLGTELWGEVTAPRIIEAQGAWLPESKDVPGAASDFDGLANTDAMAAAGSVIARAVRNQTHAGYTDWYIPARGGQLMLWANLKPLLPADEAFEAVWYWSSTQYSRNVAFRQHFDDGYTFNGLKSWEGGRARPVRRFRIESLMAPAPFSIPEPPTVISKSPTTEATLEPVAFVEPDGFPSWLPGKLAPPGTLLYALPEGTK